MRGEVVRKCAPRSFLVQTPRGHLRRNRRHLKLIPPSACNPDDLRHQKSGAVFSPDHTVRQEPYPTASSDQQPGVYLARQPGTPVTGRLATITTAVSREHFIFIDAAYTQVYSSAGTVFSVYSHTRSHQIWPHHQ